MRLRPLLLAPLLLALGAGCGSGTGEGAGTRPTVVVTNSILADVVEHVVGDAARVETTMPRGASPHEFQPSARQVADLREAAAVIANGGGFEAGLADTLDAAVADGVPVFEALEAVEALPLGDRPDQVDPHFFTDPARMADAVTGIAAFLADRLPGIDADALRTSAAAYRDELLRLDAEVADVLASVPPERRVLVTNHEVFGYFADRYGFRVLGVVVPGGATDAEPSAAELADLAEAIESAGVPAIFVDSSSPARLADALAAEVGDVAVVELYTESLGDEGSPAATYADMIRTDAERIAGALAG